MIKIRNPSDRVDVYAYENPIEGSSSGLEDPNLHLYLLVRPLDTPFWYVQPYPIMGRDGSWVANAYLGEGEKGINKDYGIKAIITNETLLVQAKYEEGKISFFVFAQDTITVTRLPPLPTPDTEGEDESPSIIDILGDWLYVIGTFLGIVVTVLVIRNYLKQR